MVTLMQNDYFNLGRVVAFLEKYQGKVRFELDYRGNYWHGTISMQKKNGSFAVIFESVDKQLSDMMDYIGQYCLDKMLTPPTWSEAQVYRREDWAGSDRPLPPGIPAMHTQGAMERAIEASKGMTGTEHLLAKAQQDLPKDEMQRQFNEAADAIIDQQITRRQCEPECNPSSFMFCSEECEAEAKAAKGRFEVHRPNLKQVARDLTMPSLDMPVGEPWPPANIELGGE